MKVTYTFINLMKITKIGERPFTDIFMQYKGRNFYSRYLGTLNNSEVKQECALLERRLKKER